MASVILISSMSGLLTSCKDQTSLTVPHSESSEKEELDPEDAEEKAKFDSMKTITFGSYKGEDIEWVILENGDQGTLLLSKYVIDYRPYECTDVMKSWQTAVLRTWLNEDFFEEAFTEEEKAKILWNETEVIDNYQYYNDEAEEMYRDSQLDRVFLMSRDELIKYYTETLPTCYCEPTAYALSQGAKAYDVEWWMRGPCEIKTDETGTDTAIPAVRGYTNPAQHNYTLYYEEVSCGIRPAMWVDLNGTVENTIQPSDWIAEVSAETSITSDGLYVYTVYPGTDFEQKFEMNINIDDYLSGSQFDLPRLCKDLGWDLYDSDGMPTNDTSKYIAAAARVDNGVETVFSFFATYLPTHQICNLTLEYKKPHAAGAGIYDTEKYYNDDDRYRNYELYDSMVGFGEHEINYVVTGFGIDGFGELSYGLSYSDIVMVVYALSFASDSSNSGKNPFYYTTMEGKESLWCTMIYDMP